MFNKSDEGLSWSLSGLACLVFFLTIEGLTLLPAEKLVGHFPGAVEAEIDHMTR